MIPITAAVLLAGAGDVAERLVAICGPLMQQRQCRSDQADCAACTCGRAATLITTLRAENDRFQNRFPDNMTRQADTIMELQDRCRALEAERDAARETALREAAITARRLSISEDCSDAEAHGRLAQALACSDAILALLNKEPTP